MPAGHLICCYIIPTQKHIPNDKRECKLRVGGMGVKQKSKYDSENPCACWLMTSIDDMIDDVMDTIWYLLAFVFCVT